jgi:glycolate oxidase iron-sulfur subunit
MACVTACPSGVQYDKLIEATRRQVERRHRRPSPTGCSAGDLRAVPAPAAAPPAARTAAPLPRTGCRRCPAQRRAGPHLTVAGRDGGARPAVRRAPRSRSGSRPAASDVPSWACSPAACRASSSRAVNAATARVLAMEGCDVVVPRRQGCCGALSVHNGREAEAVAFAAARSTPSTRPASSRSWSTRRLRLVDEGVRRAAGRRPGLRRAGGSASPPASAT